MTRTLLGTYKQTQSTLLDGQDGELQVDSNGNLRVVLMSTISGEDIVNDVMNVETKSTYLNGTTSQVVKGAPGRLFGYNINSHTTGTIKFWDNTSAATTVLMNTVTFTAGYVAPCNFPAIEFSVGLFVTVGGTVDYTIFYK